MIYDILSIKLVDPGAEELSGYSIPYQIFNGTEAAIWFLCSMYIIGRYIRKGKNKCEILYSLSFMMFGISDIIEIEGTTVLLLILKGVCLISIIGYRELIKPIYGERLL